ncbi:MAG TPA: nitroreductase family protein [Alkalispirochaeta sp.]|nr:nitroreductase family protein [Alkalispirochaeta sp.]
MELLPEIATRRSIRQFAEEPLSHDQIERIIIAGQRAPSAKNRQAWRFIAISESETRVQLQDACFGQEYVSQAPLAVALCTTNIDYRMPNGQLSYPVDLGIAAAFMMVQVEHEGLGSCPITTFREEDVKSLLSVPYQMRVVMLLAVGKPAEDPELTSRLSLDRLAGWGHW